MEDRIERLIGLIEGLVERVERLERLIVDRVIGRKLRGVDGKLGGARIGARELSEDEVELMKEFFEWVKGNWGKWKEMYEQGYMEGYDRERGLVILRKGTMEEFLGRAVDLGFKRQGVLGLLADLGILRYWERGGKRQYCIAVRVTKPMKGRKNGCYVLEYDRLREVAMELKELLGAKEAKGRGSEATEESEGGFNQDGLGRDLEEEVEEVNGGFRD